MLNSIALTFAATLTGGSSFDYELACGAVNSTSAQSQPALLLIGGDEAGRVGEVEATEWFLASGGGGDYLVLRADGVGGQAQWICDNFSAQVSSAAELSVDSMAAANDPQVQSLLADAEMVFIAGGDQSLYRQAWRDTLLSQALEAHASSGAIAGTSAGMAILGSSYYAPATSGVLSSELLNDPYHPLSQGLSHDDFLSLPWTANVITDTHLDRQHGPGNENRYGRLFALLARTWQDRDSARPAYAIGAEEGAFVGVDQSGMAQVFGNGAGGGAAAYFLIAYRTPPEQQTASVPLVWNNQQLAVKAYRIDGEITGSGQFDVSDFGAAASGGEWLDWWTSAGAAGFNYTGGQCAACGNALPPGELIHIDGFELQ